MKQQTAYASIRTPGGADLLSRLFAEAHHQVGDIHVAGW